MRNILKHFIQGTWRFALLLLIIILAAWLYWHHELKYPSTADASLNANIVAISSHIDGLVEQVAVKNNQIVKQGDLLLTIDDRIFKLDLDRAQAKLESAQLDLARAQANVESVAAQLEAEQSDFDLAQKQLERYQSLLKSNAIAQSQLDRATNVVAQKKAAVTQQQQSLANSQNAVKTAQIEIQMAQVNLNTAKLNLTYSKIYAPADGMVTNLHLRPGAPIKAEEPLFALIENTGMWIVANFLETTLRNIKPGQPAEFYFTMFPDQKFTGTVDSISYGITTNTSDTESLLPVVAPAFHWIVVAKRFPVKIMVTPNQSSDNLPFRVGATTVVTIDTQANSK